MRSSKPATNLWGKNIKRLMLAKGMKQADLARAAGLQRQNVSTYINGHNYPSPLNLAKLARGLGVEPAEIAVPGMSIDDLGDTQKSQLDRIEAMLTEIYIKLGIGIFG